MTSFWPLQGSTPSDVEPGLRVVSWNVLADAYLRPSFYPRVEPTLLRRGARTGAIVEAIASFPAEVFCLQEVEPPLLEALRGALSGWHLVDQAKRGRPDGVAIVSRPGTPLEEPHGLVFADGQPDREDSGHVALVASVRLGPLRVEVATTHLRWDPPETPLEQRWAVREVRQLLGSLSAPALLCGDFNFTAEDLPYRMLTDAGFMDPHAADPRPTCNPNGGAKRIDYLLHTRELTARALPAAPIGDETPLPNPAMPSDHLPIAVELLRLGLTAQMPRSRAGPSPRS